MQRGQNSWDADTFFESWAAAFLAWVWGSGATLDGDKYTGSAAVEERWNKRVDRAVGSYSQQGSRGVQCSCQ